MLERCWQSRVLNFFFIKCFVLRFLGGSRRYYSYLLFLYARSILIGSNTGILTIPKTALHLPVVFMNMMLLIFTESTKQELASLIASFNKAWNHVRLNLDQQGTILLCSVIPLHMFTPGSSLIANNCFTLVELLRRVFFFISYFTQLSLDCFEGEWAPLAKSNKECFAITAIWVIQWTVNYAIHSILSRFDELSWHNES